MSLLLATREGLLLVDRGGKLTPLQPAADFMALARAPSGQVRFQRYGSAHVQMDAMACIPARDACSPRPRPSRSATQTNRSDTAEAAGLSPGERPR